MTSEFLLLVSVPALLCLSMRSVEVPPRAAIWRAMARPTAPAPMTYLPISIQRDLQMYCSRTAWVKSAWCAENAAKVRRCNWGAALRVVPDKNMIAQPPWRQRLRLHLVRWLL